MFSNVNKFKKYDNLIMSWSCFGDFILISESIKTLINTDTVKKGIIITHEKNLKGLLDPVENIELLYPTQNMKDFLKLILLSFQENIFVLHDMPSHNRFSKEIRLVMSIILTKFRIKSKLILMLDKQFEGNITTKISKVFSNKQVIFDKTEKIHISQYMLNKLSESKIIHDMKCTYNVKLNEEYFDISYFGENYIVINPFASSEDKSMSVDWYIEFLNKLPNLQNRKIILIGGKKDFKKCEEIKNKSKINNIINVCGLTTFKQVLYILKNSYVTINIDSGPTHYAAVYKKPQIILWGGNKNYAYMPVCNPNAIFIFGDKIITANKVYFTDINFTKYPNIDTVLNACKEVNI